MNDLVCSNNTTQSHLVSIHAEHAAIQKLLKLNNYRKILKSSNVVDIVVIRINRNGKLGYSRPCKRCIKYMMRLNEMIKINNVYYSHSDGIIYKEQLKFMYDSPLTKYSHGDS